MKRYIALMVGMAMVVVAGCTSQADVVSRNLSTAAEEFEISRRIVMFNGITDNYLLSIEGRCSIEVDALDNQLEVTCKVGPCLLYTSPSPRDRTRSRMPSSA